MSLPSATSMPQVLVKKAQFYHVRTSIPRKRYGSPQRQSIGDFFSHITVSPQRHAEQFSNGVGNRARGSADAQHAHAAPPRVATRE